MKHSKSLNLSLYKDLLGLKSAAFSRIVHEDAIVAIVYKITKPDGSAFILKICEREKDYFREVNFLTLLANQISVPKIVQTVPPGNVHGAILMECLPGDLLKPSDLTESLSFELGRSLAIIHNNRLNGYGDPAAPPLSQNPRDPFTFKFEEGLDECKNNLPIDLVKKCEQFYKSRLPLLDSVNGPCLVHRDFRPGNIMVHEGRLMGVIDWAGARASFAEEDFCLLEPWLNNFYSHFLDGYASVRKVPQYKSLVPFLRLNKAIATIGFTVKKGTWNTTEAKLYQLNRQFLEALL